MINMPSELEYLNTAVIGGDLVNQIICLYNEDPELAKEMAFAAIIYTVTGAKKIVSDNLIIKMSLLGSKTFIEKSTSKYIEKQGHIEAKEIKEKRLDEIAALLAQKVSQAEISRQLGIPKSTMSDRCKIIKNKYPHLLDTTSGQISFSNPDDSDENPAQNQNFIFSPYENVRSVREKSVSEPDPRYPAGISDEISTQDISHLENYDIICPEYPERPGNPAGRPNKNKNKNQNKNKNKNILYPPGQKVPDDEKHSENVRMNPNNDDDKKIRIHPNPNVVIENPDISFETQDKKIRMNSDENQTNKNSGQINKNDVIKNSDTPGQKDDDKNEPMTAEQIQWLRDKGYNY